MINDVIDLKIKNSKDVLDVIRFSDTLTKKNIAEKTGLSITTVSTICNDLKRLGVISDEKSSDTRVGRIPNRITFCYQNFFAAGFDLQIVNVLGFSISNLRNELQYLHYYDISDLHTIEEIVQFAKDQFDEIAAKLLTKDSIFAGIGVSVPAIFDTQDCKLVSSSIDMYNGVHLKDLFVQLFNIPTYIDNSSNFKAITAYTTKKFENIVCLDISQGTGVGVICNGRLLRGKNGYGAEVAHVPIGNPELKCPSCGNCGCIEAELQLEYILNQFPQRNTQKSVLEQWSDIVTYLKEEKESYHDFLARTGFLVGQLSTILINLFDPTIFTITGYIADIFDLIEPYFMAEVEKRCALSLQRNLAFQIIPNDSSSLFAGICDTIYDKWSPLLNSRQNGSSL